MYSGETGYIPDDTIDKVMAKMNSQQTDDEQVTEEPTEEEEAASSAENTVQELKEIIQSLKAKIDETEINVLYSQIEISQLFIF